MTTTQKITVDQVQLGVSVSDWREAIRAAAKPLVDSDNITTAYVDAMISSVEKLGPYIVIAPGLALGHARPSEAVHKTGFSVATLSTPVKFGNKDNDPVDVVVILASVNDTDHLELLQKVVLFLNEAENLATLRAAKTPADAQKIVDKINGGEDNASD